MDLDQKYASCVEALKDYAACAGFTDVVLGLSGGIDSALVAVMCADAFGPDRVHAYMLPGPYSSDHSITDAEDLAANLNIKVERISIVDPYEAFVRTLEDAVGGKLAGLASENTQARCRMVCLMALSNAFGWMMVNTGNKSEAAMGFSTLYGDTSGAFAPIGGLYKTDVFALSRWVNERAVAEGKGAPIPEHIITKPPSAELSPGAEDEKALGIDYETLDKILIAHFEQGKSAEEIVAAGFDADEVTYAIRRTNSYAFKRAVEPPFPDVKFYA
jgi:NAD+ synthase (glutamine-hydrolysing)